VRVQDAHGPFHDQPVKVRRAQVLRERFPQPVQEIEYPVFFDLQFLSRPLEILNASTLPPQEE
jgi:hypothetical protein